MMSALPLASAEARLRKLLIPFQNDFLDGALYKNFFKVHVLPFFLVFKHDFIRFVDFTRVMPSQIRSHIEYLLQTEYILVLIL